MSVQNKYIFYYKHYFPVWETILQFSCIYKTWIICPYPAYRQLFVSNWQISKWNRSRRHFCYKLLYPLAPWPNNLWHRSSAVFFTIGRAIDLKKFTYFFVVFFYISKIMWHANAGKSISAEQITLKPADLGVG